MADVSPKMANTSSSTQLKEALCVVALAAMFLGGHGHFADPDLWHGISLARESLQQGRVLLEDPFAYTPTVSPVVHHEWAEGILLYVVVTLGGATGVLILKHLITGAIAIGSFLLARRRGASLGVLCWVTPIAIILSWIGMTTIRAQVFTLLFIVALLWLLEKDRAGGRRWILAWLPLYLVWLNVHGGFVVALVIYGLYVVEQALGRRPVGHLVAVGAVMVPLISINPYGLAYYPYLWNALRLDRSLIGEWRPLWNAWPPVIFVYGISVVIFAYGAAKAGLRRSTGWSIVLLTAYAALRHQRHLSIYAIAWLVYVPALLQPTELGRVLGQFWSRRLAPSVVWILVLVCSLTAAGRNEPWALRLPANPGESSQVLYPVGAVAYLHEVGFRGNLMTPFTIGAYVSWKLYPAVKVSLDGRYEVAYSPEALVESRRFYFAEPGWKEALTRYPTDAVLVEKSQGASRALRGDGEWALVYEDDVYEVYARPGLVLPKVDRRGQVLCGSFP